MGGSIQHPRFRAGLAMVLALIVVAATGSARADIECVGNPPRQTEDPMSPPCVPFFEGDNGGATYDGVTADQITVVLYNDEGVSGDLSDPDSMSGDPDLARTMAAQLRYFNERYQTYGRTVRVIAVPSTQGDIARIGDAQTIVEQLDPFAIVPLVTSTDFIDAITSANRIVTGMNRGLHRAFVEARRPYVWSFMPDQETEAATSASFMCRELYRDSSGRAGGGKARLSKDPTLATRTRSFGLLSSAGPADFLSSRATQLIAQLNKRCPRAGHTQWFDSVDHTGDVSTVAGPISIPVLMRYKLTGITTVTCYCDPDARAAAQTAATAIGYSPEWYWDDATGAYELPASASPHANIGITAAWRGPALHQQIPYQAYLQAEPDTQPDPRWNPTIYYSFLTLFQGIQAAGPNLTPESHERGMFTFQYLNRKNPFVPMGGFGSYETPDIKAKKAVAPYSFLDTAMGWWWDPTGTPPGGQRGQGCVRVQSQGLRSFAGEWPLGDATLMLASDPCTQRVLTG